MKNCLRCRHAMWERTKSGALHRSGDGLCTWTFQQKTLAQAFYWVGYDRKSFPKPNGGPINRHRELEDHCVYYVREGE